MINRTGRACRSGEPGALQLMPAGLGLPVDQPTLDLHGEDLARPPENEIDGLRVIAGGLLKRHLPAAVGLYDKCLGKRELAGVPKGRLASRIGRAHQVDAHGGGGGYENAERNARITSLDALQGRPNDPCARGCRRAAHAIDGSSELHRVSDSPRLDRRPVTSSSMSSHARMIARDRFAPLTPRFARAGVSRFRALADECPCWCVDWSEISGTGTLGQTDLLRRA